MKLVLFGLLSGDADQYITAGAFKGQRGLFTHDQRGAVVGVDGPAACTPGSRRPHGEAGFYALGYALWTGVAVVSSGLSGGKRRQFKQALDAYEAAQREKARAGSDQASGDDVVPTTR